MHEQPIPRNLKFDVDPQIPRHWHGGRRSVTLFFDNLSIFFPAGERFFLASVKAHRAHVTDPELMRAVRAFGVQEGFHTREHERYNRMLRAQGHPIDAMERRVEWILRVAATVLPARGQLAATCALEHMTSLLGDLLLGNSTLLDGAHPEMAALWRWHAVEETEHKAVAYDVYRAARGNYVERVVVMLVATAIFWAKVAEHQVRLMHSDGCLYSPGEWAALFRFLLLRRDGLAKLVLPYLAYFRPGFHPWQHDNRALLEDYLAQLGTPVEPPAAQAA